MKFKVYTTTTWLQEYEVEASTEEEAAEKVLSSDSEDDRSLDGEFLFETEDIHSIEVMEETKP
jgi:hypothetical protein